MLNKLNERELAYIVRIAWITPIEGADNIELIGINGWTCIAKKGEFTEGDLAVYFEIDSKLPEDAEWAAFMAPKHFKVKTMKLGKFKVISQGLALPVSAFNNIGLKTVEVEELDGKHYIKVQDTSNGEFYKEGDFLTKRLGVTYASEEDNKRKANVNPDAKINAAFARHPKIAKKWGKFIKKNKIVKFIFLTLFGKKKDNHPWPSHIASKTDVERIQNMIYILQDKQPYVATEKIDGSSCSVMAERGNFGKIKYYVCSRNVVFEDENQSCYYDENIYFEAYKKYNLKEKITQILNDYNLPNVALQMEVFGPNVQRRDYSLNEHQAMIFHIISEGVKMPMDTVVEICEKYNLPHVPIVNDNFIFPDTIEELQAYVESEGSKIDGKPREGIVFYDKATGQTYTKFVSPEFLIKFHS